MQFNLHYLLSVAPWILTIIYFVATNVCFVLQTVNMSNFVLEISVLERMEVFVVEISV